MKGIGEAGASTFRRFPWTILCACVGTVFAEWFIQEDTSEGMAFVVRILLPCALGLPLLFLVRILKEQLGERWVHRPIELAGVALLLAYGFTLSPRPSHWPAATLVRFLLMIAAFHFAAAVVPFLAGPGRHAFWQFNRRLFLRFFLATLFAGVLTVGLEIALFSVAKLFDVHFNDRLYFQLFVLMAGVFHPFFFLAGVPRDLAALETDESYPGALKAFVQYALAPLVIVYTLILYAYGAKILVTMSWPRGWVSLPVLILAGIGVLAALLLHPLRQAANERWARWYWRWFFRALAPLAILLLLSLRIRITEYGVTEERYTGVVAGAWILVVGGFFSIRENASLKWIPGSLAVICLLSAFGPWSACSVSARSQLARLDDLLKKNGMWEAGKALPAKPDVNIPESSQVESLLRYLIEHHGYKVLASRFASATPVANGNWQDESPDTKTLDLLNWLKMRSGGGVETTASYIEEDRSLPIEGWKTFYQRTNIYQGGSRTFGKLELTLRDGRLLASSDNSPAAPIPMDPLLKMTTKNEGKHSPEEMFIDWSAGASSYRIYFIRLTAATSNGSTKIDSIDLIVLER